MADRLGRPYAGADDVERAVEGPISTRLRALDGNLRSLAARGGPNVFGPILSILSGAGSFTLGAFVQEPLNYFLYTFGVASAARGVLELALAPNASDDAVTFQNMPMTTREEVLARLRYGESALEGLAERAAILRYTTGGLNVAGGLAVIPAYLAPNDWELTSGLDAFVLIGAGVSVISGVITLLSTSAEEQRWQAYERLRDRLEDADVQAAVPQAPAPRVSAGLGQLTVQF